MEKNFKTIDEQIEILKEKNLIIEDEETARNIAERKLLLFNGISSCVYDLF